MIFLIVIGLGDILVILLMLGYYILYTRTLLKFIIKNRNDSLECDKTKQALECEGNVINEPNIIIQHSLDMIPWFKDYRNVTLRRNQGQRQKKILEWANCKKKNLDWAI
jgi:hypothetical protein